MLHLAATLALIKRIWLQVCKIRWVTGPWRRGRRRRCRRITSRSASSGANAGAHGAALRRRQPWTGSGPRCDARCRGFSAAPCAASRTNAAPSVVSVHCPLPHCAAETSLIVFYVHRVGATSAIGDRGRFAPRMLTMMSIFFVMFFFRIYNVIMYIIEFILRLRFVII